VSSYHPDYLLMPRSKHSITTDSVVSGQRHQCESLLTDRDLEHLAPLVCKPGSGQDKFWPRVVRKRIHVVRYIELLSSDCLCISINIPSQTPVATHSGVPLQAPASGPSALARTESCHCLRSRSLSRKRTLRRASTPTR
jgi:hypothetical protein